MGSNDRSDWGKAMNKALTERWPKDENGELEKPEFLCRCISNDMTDMIRVNMLEAYGIPCLTVYPGDGSFGKVVLGMSGHGVDIYVPQSLYSDAKALCKEENNEEL